VKALVFYIAIYGCEAWTQRKYELTKISAFKMWCWPRMLRIPWIAKVRNEDIRNQIKEEESLVGRTIRQKIMYFGHVMRGNSLEQSVMSEMGEGARGRGRPKMRWLDEVIGSTELSLFDLRNSVDYITGWRRYVMGVTRDLP